MDRIISFASSNEAPSSRSSRGRRQGAVVKEKGCDLVCDILNGAVLSPRYRKPSSAKVKNPGVVFSS